MRFGLLFSHLDEFSFFTLQPHVIVLDQYRRLTGQVFPFLEREGIGGSLNVQERFASNAFKTCCPQKHGFSFLIAFPRGY